MLCTQPPAPRPDALITVKAGALSSSRRAPEFGSPKRVSEQPGCALTFILRGWRRCGRRRRFGASGRRLGAGGPRAWPPIPLLGAPGGPLLREGAEDPVVLGKSQDGFDAVQPRGAPAGAAEQVAGEREAAVGHGWGAARQVHGGRRGREDAARALGFAAGPEDREQRLEVGSPGGDRPARGGPNRGQEPRAPPAPPARTRGGRAPGPRAPGSRLELELRPRVAGTRGAKAGSAPAPAPPLARTVVCPGPSLQRGGSFPGVLPLPRGPRPPSRAGRARNLPPPLSPSTVHKLEARGGLFDGPGCPAPRARFAQACTRGADALRPTSPGGSASFQPPPLPQTRLLPPRLRSSAGLSACGDPWKEPEKATRLYGVGSLSTLLNSLNSLLSLPMYVPLPALLFLRSLKP